MEFSDTQFKFFAAPIEALDKLDKVSDLINDVLLISYKTS